MDARTRREFLHDVGSGMLVAGAGTLIGDLGATSVLADDRPDVVSLGRFEPLASVLSDTPLSKLQPAVVKKLADGETNLSDLISAAALMNARLYGGQDYVGYHCEMALTPALEMASELPTERQALPVLKVLYRISERLHHEDKAADHALKRVAPGETARGVDAETALRDAARDKDMQQAERIFAGICSGTPQDAYNQLQSTVLDFPNVHRVVLTHRCWQLTRLIGQEHAHTLLRQCVRHCVQEEGGLRPDHGRFQIRKTLPKALDQYRLFSRGTGSRQPDDGWVAQMSDSVYRATNEQALEMTAAALAEGITPDAVGEALALAANQLMLRHSEDEWRGKFLHGNSTGLHAADAMNAYRHIARDCDERHAIMSLLVGAYYVARSAPFAQEPYPHESHLERIAARDPSELLDELDDAVRSNDQARAAAVAHVYGELGHPPGRVFNRLLHYAVSEDGKLHNEKYYRTARDEFANTRKAYRWRHVVSLARVMASSYGLNGDDRPGHRAPGYEDACRLLNVTV